MTEKKYRKDGIDFVISMRRYKQDRHLSDSKMKAPMLPIENEPHFTDYFKDNRADSPGGNVVFPPVEDGRLKLPWMAVF